MSLESFSNNIENGPTLEQYKIARQQAAIFIREIDPNLTVRVERSIITPSDSSTEEYKTWTLKFEKDGDPDFSWTMEIDPSEEYLKNRFEDIVRKIYLERNVSDTAK